MRRVDGWSKPWPGAGGASVTGRARALEALGWVAFRQSDLDRAQTAATEGLDLVDEVEIEGSLVASFQVLLGELARIREDYERAKELSGRSLVHEQGGGR